MFDLSVFVVLAVQYSQCVLSMSEYAFQSLSYQNSMSLGEFRWSNTISYGCRCSHTLYLLGLRSLPPAPISVARLHAQLISSCPLFRQKSDMMAKKHFEMHAPSRTTYAHGFLKKHLPSQCLGVVAVMISIVFLRMSFPMRIVGFLPIPNGYPRTNLR